MVLSFSVGAHKYVYKLFNLPLVPCLSSGCPATTVFWDNIDVGVVSLVFCLQAGQVGRRGHAPANSNFAQTLEPMSGSHWEELTARLRFLRMLGQELDDL